MENSPQTHVLTYAVRSSDQPARTCLMAGFNGFLVKSEGVDGLLPPVEALLERRMVLASSVADRTHATAVDPAKAHELMVDARFTSVETLKRLSTSPLRTKLLAPERRAESMTRPHLLTMMQISAQHRVLLIVAPAGYGKTTLLVDWLAIQHPAAAWITLDSADNEPARLWAAIAAALSSLYLQIAGSDPVLRLPYGDVSAETVALAVLKTVVDRISADGSQECAYLVLDDFHLLRSRAATAITARLLDSLPPQLKLVIASRTRPVLPLARLRVNQEVIELRAADLAFTEAEVEQFAFEVMDLSLTREELATLAARIEGWPAALQLLRLALQGAPNPSEVVARFTGSNRHIVDYLVEQVLAQQPPAIQAFLLHTCVLDRMSASLCEALLPQKEGRAHRPDAASALDASRRREFRAILENLEASSFFVMALDQDGQWYRYHQLFADALRQRLHLDHPDLEATLHDRASLWYEREGDSTEAIHQAALAHDWERISCLLKSPARPPEGSAAYLAWGSWTRLVPSSALRLHPHLAPDYIVYMWLRQRIDEARSALRTLEDVCVVEADSTQNEATVNPSGIPPGRIEALRVMISGVARQDPDEVAKLAQHALERLAPDDAFYRAAMLHAWSVTLLCHDRLREAMPLLSEAVALADWAGSTQLHQRSLGLYAHLLVDTGDLLAASNTVREVRGSAESSIEDHELVPALEYTAAHIAYQRDELDEASSACLRAIQSAQQHEEWDYGIRAHLLLSDVNRARHDLVGALRELEAADDFVRDAVSHNQVREQVVDAIAARRFGIAIAQGEPDAAGHWCNWASTMDGDPCSLTSWISRPVLNASAHALLLEGHAELAVAFLAPLIARAETAGVGEAYLGLLVLEATARDAAGQRERALRELAMALSLAAPQQNRRFFLDEGTRMVGLLPAVLEHHSLDLATRIFTRDLLTRLSMGSLRPPATTPHLVDHLVEPLTERELTVLQLVAQGLSNQEIADHLIIELSTVKWYITSFHGKLGVGRRTQAVARARELGLLA